ncbi:unnamed protein product [Peniophora sp. CBMAI 1063]|nr:unnamed protein product [Peniophora sp. CBMAI 1063]
MSSRTLSASRTLASRKRVKLDASISWVRYASSDATRPYQFHVGASWLAKPADRATRKNTTPFAPESPIGKWRDETLTLGGPSSSRKGAGEDFFYIQDMRNQSGLSIGVADGVGGWVSSGVDPSRFSQALMYYAQQYAAQSWPGEPETDPTQEEVDRKPVEGVELMPKECLDLAHKAVLKDKSIIAGSSTACLVNFNAALGTMRAANLGDSGFLIIRSSSVYYRQRSQTHFFNCPKQLAKLPSFMGSTTGMTDYAEAADEYETKLRDGDLVVLYTDGLSDNVFNSEITAICSLVARAGGPEEQQVQTMADRIVDYARSCMNNMSRVSPFEKAATKASQNWYGGKMDDVTVLVAMVREVL